MFLLGTFLGYPYYVPTSEFALNFDGENAAMVAALFDIVGAIIAAPFTQASASTQYPATALILLISVLLS